ncbi:MAG: substrate-binding domain-containing protein [Planctomycetaceae bacterium]
MSDHASAARPDHGTRRRRQWLFGLVWLTPLALLLFWFPPGKSPPRTLVVYCAHDAEYARPLLERFTQQTGIAVEVRFDTEATKSLGLVNRLLAEREVPQCDVFWNNELLGTNSLAKEGLLREYRGPGWKSRADRDRDPGGLWTGFAARLRLWMVAPDRCPAQATEIERRLSGNDLRRVALAKPLFGTTLTQYVLWHNTWGEQRLWETHDRWLASGLRLVDGNAATKNLVVSGACDIAFTDSDDYWVARDAGARVDATPVRVEGATICIPNTVAILRGTRQPLEAERLVEFLLSPEAELALARSPSRQVPLGPVQNESLPPEVRELREWANDGVDLRNLEGSRRAVLARLTGENPP